MFLARMNRIHGTTLETGDHEYVSGQFCEVTAGIPWRIGHM
jgi:hypothetical protein